jgi:hypothetical protein
MLQPVSGENVVLVPDRRERTDLFKTATTDHDGHFAFSALTPGGYKVFSWETLPEQQYYEKEVLVRYEAQGKPVQVQESLRTTIDLRIITDTRQ